MALNVLVSGVSRRSKHSLRTTFGIPSVRNGSSPFHGVRANCANAKERKEMRALEEAAPPMIEQCDI